MNLDSVIFTNAGGHGVFSVEDHLGCGDLFNTTFTFYNL